MNNSTKFWLALAALPVAAQAQTHEYRTSSWYAEHPQERAQVMAICRDHAGLSQTNPNCGNAAQGGITYALRDAERRIGVVQSPNSAAYWKDPANASDLKFFKTQCQRHPESQQGLYCTAIKASGN